LPEVHGQDRTVELDQVRLLVPRPRHHSVGRDVGSCHIFGLIFDLDRQRGRKKVLTAQSGLLCALVPEPIYTCLDLAIEYALSLLLVGAVDRESANGWLSAPQNLSPVLGFS
jgi:hypothetical protein